MERLRRNILAGLLTVIPLWITVWMMWFILDYIIYLGRPFVFALAGAIRPYADDVSDLLVRAWFQSAIAIVIVLAALYLIGAATNAVVGRRILRLVDSLIDRVPLAKTIYGATRTLIDSVRSGQQGGQKAVLIDFPHQDMRAVGIVTAIFHASDTGEELAAVYVPTTPNPTSGYVEIVPTRRLVWLDWTVNDAMSFIVSGGAMTPKGVRMTPGPRAANVDAIDRSEREALPETTAP
ncbi:DUF502 domain-containing protein [Microvirga subterranea]|uniref:Putative membrane protein n=1 Tax=Microvirga subterranea TaxID=186651 RepID=A0A370HJ03_9HYPH|nr:DUF502 domain-containing protein [Microvirga subterranea]RDI57935.1 putative membrane protein [Microvirga subterranea]